MLDESSRQTKLNELRAAIQIGIDELDHGKGGPLDIEALKRELREKLKWSAEADPT